MRRWVRHILLTLVGELGSGCAAMRLGLALVLVMMAACVPPPPETAPPDVPAPIERPELRHDFDRTLTRDSFDALHEERPGVDFVKVVVVRNDLSNLEDDEVYFLDPTVYKLHIDFIYQNNLVSRKKVQSIQSETWQQEDRRFFFVNISRYATTEGHRYVLEVFEGDLGSPGLLAQMVRVVGPHTFVKDLAFKPNSLEQAARVPELVALGIPVVENEILSQDRPFQVLHKGKPAVGRLRVVLETDPAAIEQMLFNRDEIVLLQTIPNDITRVAGIVTTAPTTPLSHVNLRAMTWNVPNVMLRGALEYVWREGLEDAWVYLGVKEDGVPELRRATSDEVVAAQNQLTQRFTWRIPRANLGETRLLDLYDLRSDDVVLVGAKAANLGEVWSMRSQVTAEEMNRAIQMPSIQGLLKPGQMGWRLYDRVAPPRSPRSLAGLEDLSATERAHQLMGALSVPPGFVIPFGVYRAFLQMPENAHLEPLIREVLSDPQFQRDAATRKIKLEVVRDAIRSATFPPQHRDDILARVQRYFRDQKVFVRSSTNAEDLVGFNGAGLYDSVGYVQGDDAIIQAIQQVWASVWNYRAFEAREDQGIDHLTVYPGVLIQLAVEADAAGVMMTRDVFAPVEVGRTYINANPGPGTNVVQTGMAPEQLYVDMVTGKVSRVSLSAGRQQPLLPEAVAQRLAYLGALFEAHFTLRAGTPEMPQDVEWVWSKGELYIVQARPWLYHRE